MSRPNATSVNFLPTLIIDAHGAAAKQLAQQLTHCGFTADSVITCTDALAADLAERVGLLAAAPLVEPFCSCSRVRIPSSRFAGGDEHFVQAVWGYGGERDSNRIQTPCRLSKLRI